MIDRLIDKIAEKLYKIAQYYRVSLKSKISKVCSCLFGNSEFHVKKTQRSGKNRRKNLEYTYFHIHGEFNKFPDFFVQAFKIVDS